MTVITKPIARKGGILQGKGYKIIYYTFHRKFKLITIY